MRSLLDDLKDDHKRILDILNEVRELGITGMTAQKKLLSAKGLLLAHMQKEDEHFYPALHAAAELNDGLKRTLRYFSDDMEQVSRKAMDLFKKYAGGGSTEEFSGEITILYMTLKDRIRTEEEVLFKKYEQLSRTTGQ